MCNHHPKLYGTLPLKLFDKLMITVSAQLDVSLLEPLTMISAYLEICVPTRPYYLKYGSVRSSTQNPRPLSTWFKVMARFE